MTARNNAHEDTSAGKTDAGETADLHDTSAGKRDARETTGLYDTSAGKTDARETAGLHDTSAGKADAGETAGLHKTSAGKAIPRMTIGVKGVLGIVLGVLTVTFGAGLLAAASYLISLSAVAGNIGVLTLPIVAVRFFGIGRAVCRYGERYLTHAATFAVGAQLRTRLYRAVERLSPLAWRTSQSEMARALVFDVDVWQEWYVRTLTPAVCALVTALIGAGVLAMIDVHLSLIYAVGAFFLIAVMPYALQRWTRTSRMAEEREQSALAEEVSEVVLGLTDARLLGAASIVREEAQQAIERLRQAQVRTGVQDALANGAVELTMHVTVWLTLVCACACVAEGTLGGVWLAAVVIGVSACMEAFLPMVGAVRYHETVRGVVHHLTEATDAPMRTGTLGCEAGDVVFDHVSLHADGRSIIDDVSFTVREGEHVAIVGASGSGKTTLTRLVYGHLLPDTGRVTVGGADTRELAQGAVERICAPIPQEIDLFAGTIADNVRLADPHALPARLTYAMEKSELRDLEASRTLTALGRELSGGQRQRIAIARYLMVADRPLAVWDEPLSHLSADMADRLARTLLATRDGRSLLLVTHRLDGLDAFDRILVMHEGRIIEQGSEAHLLAQNGHYARLKRAWQDSVDTSDEEG